jgi:hypothetical protein
LWIDRKQNLIEGNPSTDQQKDILEECVLVFLIIKISVFRSKYGFGGTKDDLIPQRQMHRMRRNYSSSETNALNERELWSLKDKHIE